MRNKEKIPNKLLKKVQLGDVDSTWYIGTSPVILDKNNKGLTSWWTAFKLDIFHFRCLYNAYSTTLWHLHVIMQRELFAKTYHTMMKK